MSVVDPTSSSSTRSRLRGLEDERWIGKVKVLASASSVNNYLSLGHSVAKKFEGKVGNLLKAANITKDLPDLEPDTDRMTNSPSNCIVIR